MSASDMQEIRDGMASEFRRIFAEQLAAGGYDVVAKPLDDTLQVTAGLADVYINAPDAMTAGRTQTYTMNAGRMTLVMELRDGPTGQLLARVIDRHVGTDTGYAMVANRVTNTGNSAVPSPPGRNAREGPQQARGQGRLIFGRRVRGRRNA